jgi:GNAT superfamily N-acetyltransferase
VTVPDHVHEPAVTPLGRLLLDASDGRFPPSDGSCRVLPPETGSSVEWVVSFTGHAVLVTAHPDASARAATLDGFGASLAPDVLLWLAGDGGTVGCQDAVLVARGRGTGTPLRPRDDVANHPRVRDARALRADVRVLGDERGFVTVGYGLGGLLELGIEVAPDRVGSGVGRALLGDALASLPTGATVLAQVTPGNARSLRSFLAAGFVPICSAVSIRPGRRGAG